MAVRAGSSFDKLDAIAEREENYLLRFAQQHLEDQAKPAVTAMPGDYLHLPDLPVTAWGLTAAGMDATAVWMYGTVYNEATGQMLITLTGPATFFAKRITTRFVIEQFYGGNPLPLRPGLPIPSSPADLAMLLRALADDDENLSAANDATADSPEAIAALAQRLTAHCVGRIRAVDPAGRLSGIGDVMARVLVRQPGLPPFDTIIVGVPLWVTSAVARPEEIGRVAAR